MDLSEAIQKRCQNVLRCGHACLGFEGEVKCPPCLRGTCCIYSVKQRPTDTCIVCYTDTLDSAPVIMLDCKHVFHLQCIEAVLANKWVGPTITFSFILCPICKAPIKHDYLETSMKPILDLMEDVKRKAVTRLTFENLHQHEDITRPTGRFYRNPEGYAMERYHYYQCFKCKKAYFGGSVECLGEADGDDKHDPKDLICGGCSNRQRQQICKDHGTDYLEYKCRFCCSVAVYYCFGTTHFCYKCHQTPMEMTNMAKSKLPKCPAGPNGTQLTGECPLKCEHPPTGEEFSLGCGICSNNDTF